MVSLQVLKVRHSLHSSKSVLVLISKLMNLLTCSCVFGYLSLIYSGAPSQAIVRSAVANSRFERSPSILPTCSLCNLVVRGIFQSFDIGLTNEEIVDSIAMTCVSLNLFADEVCRGVATSAAVRKHLVFS